MAFLPREAHGKTWTNIEEGADPRRGGRSVREQMAGKARQLGQALRAMPVEQL
jgi:hypothetical protein